MLCFPCLVSLAETVTGECTFFASFARAFQFQSTPHPQYLHFVTNFIRSSLVWPRLTRNKHRPQKPQNPLIGTLKKYSISGFALCFSLDFSDMSFILSGNRRQPRTEFSYIIDLINSFLSFLGFHWLLSKLKYYLIRDFIGNQPATDGN